MEVVDRIRNMLVRRDIDVQTIIIGRGVVTNTKDALKIAAAFSYGIICCSSCDRSSLSSTN